MAQHAETHRRLAALFGVAAVCATVAAVVGNATAGPVAFPVAEPAHAAGGPQVTHACPVPDALRPAFEHAARDTGLPLSMLVAIGKVESNLMVDARSAAGARGVLQLMPSTAAALQMNVDDPDANVLAGARYLRQMLDRFDSTDLALAAYNAGPTAVAEAGGAPSAGVRAYVAEVSRVWSSIAGCS